MQTSGERGGHAFTGNLLPTLIYKSVIGLGCSPPVKQNALSACPSRSGVCVIPSADGQVRGKEVGHRASWAPPTVQMLLSHSFLWIVPIFPLLARAVVSWYGLGDQSRLSLFFYKTNSQNSIVAERACYMEAGLGEAEVLVETHFLILFYFFGGRHCLVLNAQALRVAFLISQTRLVPVYPACFLSKFCLLRSQNPHHTK